MSQPQYRVVFSAVDGSGPIATTPVSRELALECFNFCLPAAGHPFGPHGPERMRVVDEKTWAEIRDRQKASQSAGGAR